MLVMYSNAEATVPTAAFGAQPALMGYPLLHSEWAERIIRESNRELQTKVIYCLISRACANPPRREL